MSKDYTKNQHFVPRVYLRFFSYKKKNNYYIKVFDKKLNKPFKSNINNIAVSNNFYEVSNSPKNHWEKYYNSIESTLPIIFNNLILPSKLLPNKSKIINEYVKTDLCNIIHTQLLRTRSARLYFDKLGNDIANDTITYIEQELDGVLTEEHLNILNKYRNNLDFIRSMELDRFNDKKFINKCQLYLKDKVWIIYKNKHSKKHPFITSDSPIVFYNYINKKTGFGYNGLGRSETIIIYPLNKELLIAIYPKQLLLGRINTFADKLIYVDDEYFIKTINKLQYIQSYQQIYYNN